MPEPASAKDLARTVAEDVICKAIEFFLKPRSESQPSAARDVGAFDVRHYIRELGSTYSVIADNNPRRVYLGISTFAGTVYASPSPAPALLAMGFTHTSGGLPLELFWHTHGALVTQEWVGMLGAAGPIYTCEVIYNQQR